MMGIPNWMHMLGWMINCLSLLIISITIIIAALFISFNGSNNAVITNGDPSLWWFVLFIYVIWAISFCILLASFFDRRKPTCISVTHKTNKK